MYRDMQSRHFAWIHFLGAEASFCCYHCGFERPLETAEQNKEVAKKIGAEFIEMHKSCIDRVGKGVEVGNEA